ncbi:hypothetical protein M0811_11058 [Anaeramoeba ignava]|uniref:Uncharacterized protein n=1 Tax=Anaeramoeba ignava TaxID=1746090 RepID=A0A9Q0R833_ANAIG|nr:hypothetical protein M0811_11058 [Anaeramoeba ignava]
MSKHIRVVKKTKSVQKKKKLVDVDWNQVGEKYDPMNFENKENLQKKLDEFYQNLQSNDWETRKHNILQFHKILNGNTITDFSETLIETLGKFKSIFATY